ncbi:MAG: LytTR family DNA-binding domain-containing protein [Bacteroidota bacterium]
MKILIIEDENPAASRLKQLLREVQPDHEVLGVLDTVEASVQWLTTQAAPSLIFLDIQLADGLSFELFEQVEVKVPIIFTTAYDQYALQAFQVNSIDYLLKPIDRDALKRALEKYAEFRPQSPLPDWSALHQMLQPQRSKQRFLIRVGEQYRPIPVAEIAYFFAEAKMVMLHTQAGRSYPVDHTLDELEAMVDAQHFFRLNRKYLARLSAIQGIHTYFNGRLKIALHPATEQEVIVSRTKVPSLKQWLNS